MKTRFLPAVKKYIKLLDELPELIKKSEVKEKGIYTALGMSKKTWHNRKTLKNWTPEEVFKVVEILERQGLRKDSTEGEPGAPPAPSSIEPN